MSGLCGCIDSALSVYCIFLLSTDGNDPAKRTGTRPLHRSNTGGSDGKGKPVTKAVRSSTLGNAKAPFMKKDEGKVNKSIPSKAPLTSKEIEQSEGKFL